MKQKILKINMNKNKSKFSPTEFGTAIQTKTNQFNYTAQTNLN